MMPLVLAQASTIFHSSCEGKLGIPLEGRQGSRGCIPEAPGETGIPLEWKQRTPLCSRVETGISWSSLGGLKGVKPPEAFGERSRGWRLGHAGDKGTHIPDDVGVSGRFSSGGPRVRFLTRYAGEVSEPLVGRQGSRVSMRVLDGMLHEPGRFLPAHGPCRLLPAPSAAALHRARRARLRFLGH